MAVKLRGHHLLCMLTYQGAGYSAAFCATFDQAMQRLLCGEDIEIVEGPDDLCRPRLDDLQESDVHCWYPRITRRDSLACQAVGAVLGRPLAAGDRITALGDHLTELRRAFAEGTSRVACQDCHWDDLCSSLAANGFVGTRLMDDIPADPSAR